MFMILIYNKLCISIETRNTIKVESFKKVYR